MAHTERVTEVVDPATGRGVPQRAPRSRGRRIAFWLGLGLVFAGIGILLWLAWEIWGTTWISNREQRHEIVLFQQDSAKAPPALLLIPRFGSDFTVPINEGISDDVLSKGVGHFLHTGPGRATTGPGQIGNYALAGHRITHGQPFANLPELRPGDKVYVITHRWTYEYVLDTNPNDLVVPFTASWVLTPDPQNPNGGPQAVQGPQERIITLTTCSELFHTDNRLVTFGHLVGKPYPTNPQHPTAIP